MDKIVLTEEERKRIIDETNGWIEQNNLLAMDILGLSDSYKRIGLFQRITAKKDDRQLFNTMRETLIRMNDEYYKNAHKIEVNKRLLGIKQKKKKLLKNKTL